MSKKRVAAIKKIAEGATMREALLEAGYSPNSAKNPSQITKGKKWQELLEQYLPDDFLAEKHKALLNKLDGEDIDTQAVKAGLDMAYKLKGSYAAEKRDITSNGEQIGDVSNVALFAAEIEKKLKDKKT